MTDRIVIFLHLPKAAGSTLNRVIAQQYAPEQIYKLGEKPPAVVAQELAEPSRARVRLLSGHVNFGIHSAVPGEFTYITVIRDPVERLLSHFHFARLLPQHRLHDDIVAGRLTLRDLARQLANLQTRYLAGEAARGTAETADAAALASAKENLSRYFAVVGLAERFDESLILMQRKLGWNVRPVRDSNVTRGRPKRASHSEEDLHAIREANPLDCELHDWARARFDKEVADAGLAFRASVGWLRARNRAWRVAGRFAGNAGAGR